MAGSDVKIEIDRSTTGGTFTNHDIIKGTIKLTVTTSLTLNYIQVKLQGITRSQLIIPQDKSNKRDSRDRKDRRDRKDKDKYRALTDSHKVIYDTLIVFPPDNVRQVSNAKEFTLTPGNYSYPFEFKLPLNSSCVKFNGLSNMINFNLKSPELLINNRNVLYSNKLSSPGSTYVYGSPSGNRKQPYHITTQLPPSLSGMDDFASIKYFVKVTCKRSSFLKTNLREFDPFVFLPLDLDDHNNPIMTDVEEYREVFVRKELIFKNRIPEIIGVKLPAQATSNKALPQVPVTRKPQPKRGFFQKMFDPTPPSPYNEYPNPPPPPKKQGSQAYYPEIASKDVPFSFEIRFRDPAFLIPTKKPSFKLFLVSKLKPCRYTLAEYGKPQESNGLGVVYLQKLKMELTSTTAVSVIEDDTKETYSGSHEEVTTICNNMYQNLKFDLMSGKPLKSSLQTSNLGTVSDQYEIEIPTKFFNNAVLPEYLAPSFRTCNISRKYRLTITAGFSSEKIVDVKNLNEIRRKLKYVELQYPNIKVLSGLNMTSALLSNASKSSMSLNDRKDSHGTINTQRRDSQQSFTNPPMPPRPIVENESNGSIGSEEDSSGIELPTYDDVMRESNFQDDSEHQRARRRYQQHSMYYQNLDNN